jgi:hypothetical protein
MRAADAAQPHACERRYKSISPLAFSLRCFFPDLWTEPARRIQGHLGKLYGTEISPDFIRKITDAVLDEDQEWQTRRCCSTLHQLQRVASLSKLLTGESRRAACPYVFWGREGPADLGGPQASCRAAICPPRHVA